MKVLLDECVPHRLRARLFGHDVYTVAYMGWAGIKNSRLLALAAGAGFNAFVTTDKNIEYQQPVATLPFALLVLDATSNAVEDILPLVPQILAALGSLSPKSVVHVP